MASNGTRVDDDGRVRTKTVTLPYTILAGEVHINGTQHTAAGDMIVTVDANVGASDVFINGVRHTDAGVRYTDVATKANDWPEGFTMGDDGRQGIIAAVQTLFIRGIARNSAGQMSHLAA